MLQTHQIAALAVAAVLVVTLSLVSWVRRRRTATRVRQEREALEATLESLRREARGAVEMAVRNGRALRLAEQQLQHMNERIGLLELRGEGRAYDKAISLARRGVNAENLASNLGLSKGEAELMAVMHAPRKAG